MSADALKEFEVESLNEHIAHVVEDVDEEVCVSLIEIFLLYTLRSPDEIDAGLGCFDSKNDILSVELQLDYTDSQRDCIVQIHQNTTALRSTAGDTGSVVWRSSVYLAEYLACQLKTNPITKPAWFTWEHWQGRKVLELGAGTGALPICMSQAIKLAKVSNTQPTRWLATDRRTNLVLLRKNLALISPSSVQTEAAEIDWIQAQQAHSQANPHRLYRFVYDSLAMFQENGHDPKNITYPDWIFCTDCVYNPSLHAPLIAAFNLFSGANTRIVIMLQLREVDNTREFLSRWVAENRYRIYSIDETHFLPHFRQGYACWIASPKV